MKHVREDLPDVQMLRPEVSASLASVLDRMTDKDLERRYQDAGDVVADLEDALAIEAARSGRSTGEATAVLATLPDSARRRLPLRMRRRIPIWIIAALLLLAVAAAVVAVLFGSDLLDRAERGTGAGKVKPAPGTKVVSVKRSSAQDFDPLGKDGEHPERARLAVDKDPGTTWTTETYSAGNLGNKAGVGIYVDAAPSVAASTIEIDTPKTGWIAELYVAPDGPAPTGMPDDLWSRAGGGTVRRRKQRFTLRTDGKAYRYYLVWITELPPGEHRVEISDVSLFAKQPK
jgi:serine/threonine-protein kinase